MTDITINISSVPAVAEVEGISFISIEEYKAYKDNIPYIGKSWWLRPFARDCTPGVNGKSGTVFIDAHHFNIPAGVRPCLRISNIKDLGLKIGNKIDFGNKRWTIISDSHALCDGFLGRIAMPINPKSYVFSDIRQYIEDWFYKVVWEQRQKEQFVQKGDDINERSFV